MLHKKLKPLLILLLLSFLLRSMSQPTFAMASNNSGDVTIEFIDPTEDPATSSTSTGGSSTQDTSSSAGEDADSNSAVFPMDNQDSPEGTSEASGDTSLESSESQGFASDPSVTSSETAPSPSMPQGRPEDSVTLNSYNEVNVFYNTILILIIICIILSTLILILLIYKIFSDKNKWKLYISKDEKNEGEYK